MARHAPARIASATDAITWKPWLVLWPITASSLAGINQAEDAGDADTSDLFTEVSRKNDKLLWFVETHPCTQPRAHQVRLRAVPLP